MGVLAFGILDLLLVNFAHTTDTLRAFFIPPSFFLTFLLMRSSLSRQRPSFRLIMHRLSDNGILGKVVHLVDASSSSSLTSVGMMKLFSCLLYFR